MTMVDYRELYPHAEATPADRVDPSEFWKDEPGKCEGYASIYLRVRDNEEPAKTGVYHGKTLSSEIQEWLTRHVGPRQAFGLSWFQCLDEDLYDWSIRGIVEYSGEPHFQVYIKDLRKAMVFKLVWGGQ